VSALSVTIGGGLGALCRYGVNQLVLRYDFSPILATGFVNIVGSALIGMIAAIIADDEAYARFYPLVATGFLGGLTTFSTFSLETLTMIQNGQSLKAVLYAGISIVLALLGVWIGIQIVR